MALCSAKRGRSGLNLNGEVGGVYDGWMWIGEGYLGKSIMKRCEEERE